MPDELKRTLGFSTVLLIAVNSIMGTGIFFLPALGAKEAGNLSILAWILLSFIAIYIAMCFAELASMFPGAGGVYEYCKQAFGSFPSFLIGWGTLIAGNITIAMLIVGAVRYLNPAMPEIYKIIVALLFIFTFNYVAFKGMDTSAVMLVTFACITLASLAAIVLPGLFKMNFSNFTPLVPEFVKNPINQLLIVTFLIAETFFGWESVTFLSDETKNPKKNIPRALILGTIAMSLICFVYVISALGSVGWEIFGNMHAPLADLAAVFYGSGGITMFTLLVYLSIIGSVAGWIVSTPRLILALAKDKLFIAQLADVHPVNKTPHKAIFFQTILTSILVVVGSGSYEALLALLLPLLLLLYSTVLLSVVVMRFTKKNVERGFKAPLGKFLPLVVIAIFMVLIGIWLTHEIGAWSVFKTLLSFLAFGIPMFFLLVFYYNPDAIIGMTNSLARLTLFLEPFVLPKRIRKTVLQLFKDLKEKAVLEFGCGVGTLTLHLAEKVGPRGRVTATDLSKRNVELLKKRLLRRGYGHVEVIHDEHQVNRVHPDVKEVDIVFSVGMLSYLQDVKKVLGEISHLLPEHGKVCFLEYIDFFWFLPNPAWLSNEEKIRTAFREAGFSVNIMKKKGLLWKYLIVYGFKTEEEIPFV